MVRVFVLVAVVLGAANLWGAEAPMGLKVGMSVAEIEEATGIELKPDGGDHHKGESDRLPFDMKVLSVTVDKEEGLCQFNIHGQLVDGPAGRDIIKQIDVFRQGMRAKYGEPTIDTANLVEGAKWGSPGAWCMSIISKEREVLCAWVADTEEVRKRLSKGFPVDKLSKELAEANIHTIEIKLGIRKFDEMYLAMVGVKVQFNNVWKVAGRMKEGDLAW
jgi:hypothetical protein